MSGPQRPERIDEPFGKYLLTERIAVGGMAEIFKAKSRSLGGFEKVVAIKRLHSKYSDDREFIQMLIDEARISVQLNHVNIGQVFDFDKIGDHYFISMEHIDGPDLYRVLRQCQEARVLLPVEAAVFVAIQMCHGLDYAHRKRDATDRPLRIVHRDISPQNILISFEGEVKVVDFGIAKAAQRSYETDVGVIKGKFYYMSPEQARGGAVDHRADIFSCGIVLYEMLTGQLMYRADDDAGLLSRVQQARFDPPRALRADLPRDLEGVVLRALERSPERRYANALDMGTQLQAFLISIGSHYDKARLGLLLRELFGRAEPDRPMGHGPVEERAPRHPSSPPVRPPRPSRPAAVRPFEVAADRRPYSLPTAASVDGLDAESSLALPPRQATPRPTPPATGRPRRAATVPLPVGDESPPPRRSPPPQSPPPAPRRAAFPLPPVQVGPLHGIPSDGANEEDEDEETMVYLGRDSAETTDRPGSSDGRQPAWPDLYTPPPAAAAAPPAVIHTGRHGAAAAPASSSALASASTWAAIEPPVQATAPPLDSRAERRHRLTFVAILAGLLVTAWLMTFCSHQIFSGARRVRPSRRPTLVAGGEASAGAAGSLAAREERARGDVQDAQRNAPPASAAVATAAPSGEPVSVLLRSRPAGAGVQVDGDSVPGVTPLRLRLTSGQEVRLRVSLANHVDWEQRITPSATGKNEFTARLAPKTGWVHVRSVPAGAEVTLGDVPMGRTPLELSDLFLGEDLTLELRHAGYRDLSRRIEWKGRDRMDLLLEMEAVERTPPRAARPARRRSRPRQRQRRHAARPAARPAAPAEAPLPERAAAPEAATGWGSLTVHAVPFGRVVLNGLDIGKETPLNRSPVRAGTHQVRVFFPSLGRYSDPRTVRLEPNEERRLLFRAQ